jgi:hypothetical protein
MHYSFRSSTGFVSLPCALSVPANSRMGRLRQSEQPLSSWFSLILERCRSDPRNRKFLFNGMTPRDPGTILQWAGGGRQDRRTVP